MSLFRLSGRREGEPATRGSLPDGLRVYAIGDIHGRFDLLQALYTMIRRDLDEAPPAQSVEIFLGDYVDRGPRSRDVLAWLIDAPPATGERICLLGNHEDMLLSAVGDPAFLEQWLVNGGWDTLDSYCAPQWRHGARVTVAEAYAALLSAVPQNHRDFLTNLRRSASFGSYLFVHAGLRPGRLLEEQDPLDLIWIREPFLSCGIHFGAIVVHGHTPVPEPEIRANRINIDTGAFFTGRLTCLALEGETRRFLQVEAS
jgi:serine/threonine protein phosphatase 1